MLRFLLIAVTALAVTVGGAAEAQEAVVTETKNVMTDARILMVTVPLVRDGYGISFRCYKKKAVFAVMAGTYLHVGKLIPVAYRLDDSPQVKEDYIWTGSVALKMYGDDVLSQILSANRMLVKMASKTVVTYDLSRARKGLAEFRARCSA